MRPSPIALASTITVLGLALAPSPARAQPAPAPGYLEDREAADHPVPYYPTPSSQRLPNGEYVAPMYQTSQPTYVPQSVAMSGPRELGGWRPGEAIPYGYHPKRRSRVGTGIVGLGMFVVPYAISLLTGSVMQDLSQHKDGAYLFIPVFGPWIQASGQSTTIVSVGLALDGLVQATGIAMAIVGFATSYQVLVRNDLATLEIRPLLGTQMAGLALGGRF